MTQNSAVLNATREIYQENGLQHFACERNCHRRPGDALLCNNPLSVANIIFKRLACTTIKSFYLVQEIQSGKDQTGWLH